MRYSSKARENQVATALGQYAASVKRADSVHWEFSLANGKPLGVSARLLEDWLLLDAPITEPGTCCDWWDLLRLNASLPGLSKFVLAPDARSTLACPTNFSLSMTSDSGRTRQTEGCRTSHNAHLRADIPLPDDGDCDSGNGSGSDGLLTARLLEACGGLLELLEIAHLADRVTGQLSAGESTRVNLCKAFLNDPELLMLDETTASLDPDIADKVRKVVRRVQAERGIGILYTSHNMRDIEEVCDRVIFLHKGRIVAEGTPDQIVQKFAENSLEDVFIKIARSGDIEG